MQNRAIVYRLYPNQKQKEQLSKTFGCVRFVYNKILNLQEENHKKGIKHLSKFDANTYCNHELKKKFEWLKEVDKWALTNSIFNLEDSYKRFFAGQGGYPKYKNKHKAKKSYTTNFANGNIKILKNKIQLPKLGKVKASISKLPKDSWKIKSATITENRDGSYQVSILFEYEDLPISYIKQTEENTIGLDYKSSCLYMDSNGNSAEMPHYYKLSQDKLAKKQRKLKNKQIGSKNYSKEQKKISKLHRHISNQRKDYLHKKSTEIANRYSYVCVENLNMKNMSNKGFGNGKSTLDNGYGYFLTLLDYKLKERGGNLIKVDKWFPSSQLCSDCGYQFHQVKHLSIRTWVCPKCGVKHDRDINAAINIKREGIRLLSA